MLNKVWLDMGKKVFFSVDFRLFVNKYKIFLMVVKFNEIVVL